MKLPYKKLNLILVTLLLFIYVGASFFSYNESVLIETHQGTSKLNEEIQNNSFNTNWLNKVSREDFKVNSTLGYTLKGSYLETPIDSLNLTVVMVHGVTHDRWRMMRYAQIYLKHGIDVVLYDQRKHGLSGGEAVSFSYFEGQDLEQIVQWTRKRKPKDKILAHGESLGAATVCSHSGLNEITHSVDFYVADCPFSDTEELLTLRAKEDFGIPDIGLIKATSLIAKLSDDFYFSDASPIKNIKQSKVPFLFIHGKADSYIPMQMSKDLYNAKEYGEKYLWLVDNAEHAKSITVASKEYEKTVMNYVHTIISQLSE